MNSSGVTKITKKEWYSLGGFKNSACYRRDNGRGWQYFIDHSHYK